MRNGSFVLDRDIEFPISKKAAPESKNQDEMRAAAGAVGPGRPIGNQVKIL